VDLYSAYHLRKPQWLLKQPALLADVATQPGETLMQENKQLTINYKVV